MVKKKKENSDGIDFNLDHTRTQRLRISRSELIPLAWRRCVNGMRVSNIARIISISSIRSNTRPRIVERFTYYRRYQRIEKYIIYE